MPTRRSSMNKLVITVKGFPADYPNLQKVYQCLSAAVFSSARIDQDEVEVFLSADLVPETAGRNIYASIEPYGRFYHLAAVWGAAEDLGQQIKKICTEANVFVKMKIEDN